MRRDVWIMIARNTPPQVPRDLVAAQADDDGLWFVAETAPEAYLQFALRALHESVEYWMGREMTDFRVISDDDFCEWKREDFDFNAYETTCDNCFELNDGKPSDHGMKYCCYCGKQIREKPYGVTG